ncbi:Wzz/FepE/Etk N-terminal domain-containing protein [Streptomyces buecherae]|uniref:Wzz/FepE/Etk N-terminal domain-containing protein n=1 Tax=Streptomyces buecherae TaxID=2763006 RepID=UPI001C2608F7|nr:Wzz/FepE/Etk N-terminal domain-containing protein [Streptomyces buecherae]
MSEDTIRLATIGRMLQRRWRLLAVLTAVGALVGYGVSALFPPRYTATASVLLPGQWEERELLTQAYLATSSTVVDRTAATLRWAGGGGEVRDRVSAKVADGNVIRISGTAESPERAQQLTDRLAQQFVTFAARVTGDGTDPKAATGPEALRERVEQTHRRITELAQAADPGRTVESVQARTSLEKLRTALETAVKKLDEADPATHKAGMVVMGPAARPASAAPPTTGHLVAGGAALAFLLAVVGHLTAARANRRPRTGADIAAALGSPLLGTVDVPAERPAAGRGPAGWPRRFLGLDTRWDVPTPLASGDETSRRVRYRRVCARLRSQHPPARRLLAVVPAGDEVARRAAERLAAETRGDAATPAGRGHPVLRVVDVAMAQPMVPDRDAESGVLVVISAGCWTAGELAGVAGACADGGHEIVGVVVAGAVRSHPAPTPERPAENATLALAVPGQAGGAE